MLIIRHPLLIIHMLLLFIILHHVDLLNHVLLSTIKIVLVHYYNYQQSCFLFSSLFTIVNNTCLHLYSSSTMGNALMNYRIWWDEVLLLVVASYQLGPLKQTCWARPEMEKMLGRCESL